jgi:hypothetical protein
MPDLWKIENIEEMRLREGIDDVELRAEIRTLQVGDRVKLTFRTEADSFTGETLLVRITTVNGCTFRGKLAEGSTVVNPAKLGVGSPVRFTSAQIHSISKRKPTQES